MKRRKIYSCLVTGGTGFVGSHVVDYLVNLGVKTTILTRTKDPTLRGDVSHIWGDIRDRNLVLEAVSKHDGVIHLAGRLGTSETINNPQPSVEINIMGSLNVFDAIKEYKIPCVYIAVGNHWMNNSYSITKTTSERFALMYNREYGTEIAVVRALNAYGERQKHYPVRKIIPNFILNALTGKPIPIYGNGKQKMDMIYVGDVAKILCEALIRKHGTFGKVIEAGTGQAPTVLNIANKVIKLSKSKSHVVHLPLRAGEPKNALVVANTKTLKPLFPEGFTFTPFDEALTKTIEWYNENKILLH